jgi:hypothetical protein
LTLTAVCGATIHSHQGGPSSEVKTMVLGAKDYERIAVPGVIIDIDQLLT